MTPNSRRIILLYFSYAKGRQCLLIRHIFCQIIMLYVVSIGCILMQVKTSKSCSINDQADNELRFRDMDLGLPKVIIQNKINVFERWCYRRMLRISWTEHVTMQ